MTPNQPELENFTANGINGATGEFLLPPLTVEELAERAATQPTDALDAPQQIARDANKPHLGALFDIDLTDIKQAGWAIVFHTAEDPAVEAALQPLIDHRRKQIGNDSIVKTLE